jgi:undecaprenyl-diphosphatase
MGKLQHTLVAFDQWLQQFINRDLQNPVLDWLAPVLREPKTWIPLYLFLAIWIPRRFGRKGLYWCLGFIATFGISDYLSASILKPLAGRIRPCNDPAFAASVRNLVPCGVGYSFPSTHAANHFALALFMGVTLGRLYPKVPAAAVLWAFLVGFSQIYVGLHYPLDILGGAFLGVAVGALTSVVFMKRVGLSPLVKSE